MAKREPSQQLWREAKAERVRRESEKKYRRRVPRIVERKPERARTTEVEVDLNRLIADLQAADEATRAKATRAVCPCRLGWGVFQQTMDTLKERIKDPSPQVRAQALHVFEDAYGIQSRESRDDEAASDAPDRDTVKWARQQERQMKREVTHAFGKRPRQR
jgi:hypothetical protein